MAGKVNGDFVLFDISSNKIKHITDASMSASRDRPDATSKDSNQFVESVAGDKSWEISATFWWDAAPGGSDLNYADLMALWESGATAAIDWYPAAASGETHYTGNVVVTSVVQNAPHNGTASCDVTLQGEGALTTVVVP